MVLSEMLNQDMKTKDQSKAAKNLEETCHISIAQTPQMVEVVTKVLPAEAKTVAQLKKAMGKAQMKGQLRVFEPFLPSFSLFG